MLKIGIDIGSTTVKIVVLGEEKSSCFQDIKDITQEQKPWSPIY